MFNATAVACLYTRARLNRLERTDPAASQARLLKHLVSRAKNTKFGKAHKFDTVRDLGSFQKNVPVREYSDFWQEWWQPAYPDLRDQTWPGQIPFFSMTSGTSTGRSKYIPYTKQMRRAAARGFLDLLCYHFQSRPDSRLLDGDWLGLTGPTSLKDTGTAASTGAVSAITLSGVPSWLSKRVLPPPEIASMADWEEKIEHLAAVSTKRDVRLLGGSPNWLLIFLEEVSRQAEIPAGRLRDWYPNLELIVHGGVNFTPYREKFARLMEGGHAETREMYSASEGVFAYADRGDNEGMRLHLDGLLFYEFVPATQYGSPDAERRWIGNIRIGEDYALIVSSAAGLWSYVVGDVVRFVSLSPPRLVVSGRLQSNISIFGEHLIESEVAAAVAAAASATGSSIRDYCAGPLAGTDRNSHLYLIETDKQPDPCLEQQLAMIIDDTLRSQNEDYDDLRKGDLAISPPVVRIVAPGKFTEWLKQRRGLGGQYKLPKLISDKTLFDQIHDDVIGGSQQAKTDG